LATSENKKNIDVWCSGGGTKVYTSGKVTTWDLEPGRKVKVVGDWDDHPSDVPGEKILLASRIDLLYVKDH
jgi:hypothetical protein